MKQFLKSIIKSIIPKKIQDIFTYPLLLEIEKLQKRTLCFSQEGEDLILETFFDGMYQGFFVDIGAYYPIRFSNTYLFYLKGWTGINIDARPESMKIFNEIRPKDINIEVAIGKKEETLTYYMFDEPALNGFSKEISEDRHKNTPYKIQKTVNTPLKRLETVLDENMPKNIPIQFMSIDVEGLDLEVLQSNNWEKYKPLMMLVEISVVSQGLAMDSPIHLFLTEKGYELVAKTYRTSFYKLK
jgi:FkbM family methyltransferase